MAWCLEGATSRHFGWVRNPPEALFFEFFGAKEQKEKTEISKNFGEISEKIGKNQKNEISVEIFY